MTNKHKVFVSFHNQDQAYKDKFVTMMRNHMVDVSVNTGDINPNNRAATIRGSIRDNYIREATVTVVLIGKDTWGRKHIDWEIGGSIRDTQYNSRTGLIGIYLPTHSDYGRDKYDKCKIPPRLYDNVNCEFAKLYDWNDRSSTVQKWIHEAFLRRNKINPSNSYDHFANNRSKTASGWC